MTQAKFRRVIVLVCGIQSPSKAREGCVMFLSGQTDGFTGVQVPGTDQWSGKSAWL